MLSTDSKSKIESSDRQHKIGHSFSIEIGQFFQARANGLGILGLIVVLVLVCVILYQPVVGGLIAWAQRSLGFSSSNAEQAQAVPAGAEFTQFL